MKCLTYYSSSLEAIKAWVDQKLDVYSFISISFTTINTNLRAMHYVFLIVDEYEKRKIP